MTSAKINKKKDDLLSLKFIVLVLALLVVITAFASKPIATNKPTPTPVALTSVTINEIVVPVEVADTPQSRELGLGYRDSLPENQGMLFDFNGQKQPVRFWMKGMRFPLDMIFIADGKVVQIYENAEPQEGVPDVNMKGYVSNEPVHYVLEVNAGFVEKNNIKVGDSFSF